MYLNFELIFRLLLELLEPEQLPLLYLDLDKVLQIGNKFGKIFLILLMMTMLLILPLMMEFKEVEDSLLQCCYVWHGIVQVWFKNIFFQILWKSRGHILVTFPSHLKKLRSKLRFWLEKLNCGFFHSFHSWKNTTKQLFQSKFQCRK